MSDTYNFPVYGTEGSGLARNVRGVYIFITDPGCPGLTVGDEVPQEWDIQPANEQARIRFHEQHEFDAACDELFNTLFQKAEVGKISLEQIGNFFPNM